MKECKAVVESPYWDCDTEYIFEAPEDATDEEICDIAYDTIIANLCWHWEVIEDEEGEEYA